MANVGKIFEREIRKLLESRYLIVTRSYDIVGSRFTQKKKFDFVALSSEGYFIGLEAKATRQDTLSFSRIKPHQRENLTRVAGTEHGKAYLALNFRDMKGPGQAWLIPWNRWVAMEKRWSKKSIKRGEAREEFKDFELVRITGGWKTQP